MHTFSFSSPLPSLPHCEHLAHLLQELLLSTYNVLGTVSGVEGTIVNKTDYSPFLGSLPFSGRRETTNKQIYNMSGGGKCYEDKLG